MAFRRSSRVGDRSGQICLRLGQALEQFWPRDVEWSFRQCALLRLLYRAAKLTVWGLPGRFQWDSICCGFDSSGA